jgi:hypothetical protein
MNLNPASGITQNRPYMRAPALSTRIFRRLRPRANTLRALCLAGLLRFDLFPLLGEVFRTARSGHGCAVRRSEASLECEDRSEIVGQQGKGLFRCSFILLSSIKWRFCFRQLRSYRSSDLFVGSHISAFSFCTSQFRERVSQSKISLKGYGRVPRLPVRRRKLGCNRSPPPVEGFSFDCGSR